MNQRNSSPTRITTAPPFQKNSRKVFSSLFGILSIAGFGFLLLGCPPDNTPLLQENEELTKQVTKQDSMITTLQEGNRVLQEQINRLNQELRDKELTLTQQLQSIQESRRNLTTSNQQLTQQTAQLTKEKSRLNQENQKLTRDNDWLRRQREIFRQSLQTDIKGGTSQLLASPLPAAASAMKQALSEHGYALLGNMITDQGALFITERKTSISPSIELPGFRNQYVVRLEAKTEKQTTLLVKAYYEKLSGEGKLLEVGSAEITEIERRLMQAIEKNLTGPKKKA